MPQCRVILSLTLQRVWLVPAVVFLLQLHCPLVRDVPRAASMVLLGSAQRVGGGLADVAERQGPHCGVCCSDTAPLNATTPATPILALAP